MSKQNRPALIVFGKRPRKHPRAVWFAAADAAVARWIAQQHGLSILKATARVINQLGNPVAEWQLSPRGQSMVPTVKSDTFEELKALATEAGTSEEGGIEASDEADGRAQEAVTAQQREAAKALWGALAVGSLVLAQEDDPSHGWWEAVILAVHQNTCTVYFRDHPDDGLVQRERHQLAILHPNG
jgi:hypothetical protein